MSSAAGPNFDSPSAGPASPGTGASEWCEGTNAHALIRQHFDPPAWIVLGLIPQGLTLLIGGPKVKKSFMVLGLGVRIAGRYGAIWGRKAATGSVLYLALEDPPRRLQSRLRSMLGREDGPPDLHLFTDWPTLNNGGSEKLHRWLDDHPDCALVVIDTLAMVRDQVKGGSSAYLDDYRVVSTLREIAHKRNVAIVVVHHSRKAPSQSDPFEVVSGTNGLAGAADTIAILTRGKGEAAGFLYLRGRDTEEQDLALGWDDKTTTWDRVLGTAKDFRYEAAEPILAAIRKAGRPLNPNEIANAVGRDWKTSLRSTVYSMAKRGQLKKYGRAYGLPESPGQGENLPDAVAQGEDSSLAGDVVHTPSTLPTPTALPTPATPLGVVGSSTGAVDVGSHYTTESSHDAEKSPSVASVAGVTDTSRAEASPGVAGRDVFEL